MVRCFEYMVGGLDSRWSAEEEQAVLNKWGAQGWELVAVNPRMPASAATYEEIFCTYFYFRRELQEAAA